MNNISEKQKQFLNNLAQNTEVPFTVENGKITNINFDRLNKFSAGKLINFLLSLKNRPRRKWQKKS